MTPPEEPKKPGSRLFRASRRQWLRAAVAGCAALALPIGRRLARRRRRGEPAPTGWFGHC
jgi:hypothetical protein